MGGGSEKWGSVCVVSLTSRHSNKEENMCAMCVSFLSCTKKKETERKWKGSLSRSFITPSCACCYSAYSLILQLIQFLDNTLSHQIQNTVKLTFSLQSHTTTTTALLTQVSIRAVRFCQQKPFSSFDWLISSVKLKKCVTEPVKLFTKMMYCPKLCFVN